MTFGRVSCGSITSSIKPRSAAANGLAKRSRYCSIFDLRAFASAFKLTAVDDVNSSLRAHDGDFGGRIGQIDIGAKVLGAHYAVRAAIRLPRDDGIFGTVASAYA